MSRGRKSLIALLAGVLVVAGLPALAAPPEMSRVIVVLEPGNEPVGAVADRLLAEHGGTRGFVYQHALRGFSAEVPAPAVAALERNPNVAYVDEDVTVTLAQTSTQVMPTGVDRVEADLNPWAPSYFSDVTVAVIDTGVWFQGSIPHEDLNLSVVFDCTHIYNIFGVCAGTNYVDGNGHGTHVAGIIGAKDNDRGSLGVAPGAQIYSVKVINADGTGTLSGVIAGVDVVTGRAAEVEVANMSLTVSPPQQSLDDAVNNSIAAGIVYVVAAGNNGADAAGYSPARIPDAITVSALADFDGRAGGLGAPTCRSDVVDDRLATWSNYGPAVDVAAPGVCIYSTWLDDGYNTISGTSMASPMVAGAVARYIAENGRATDRAGVLAIRNAIVGGGASQASTCGFGGDPDTHPEPLLFVNGPAFGGDGSCQVASGSNRPPAPVADSATTPEDGGVVIDVLANDSDPDGDALTVVSVGDPGNGTAASNPDGTVTYTPAPDFSGSDSFTYSAGDGIASASGTVTVQVSPVNDPPVAGFTSVCSDLSCDFTDTSTDVDGAIGAWTWSFGDGTSSTLRHPSHVFATDGTYLVSLTVVHGPGGEDTATASVTVAATVQQVTAQVNPILFDGRNATVEVWVYRTSDLELIPGATVDGEWTYADRRGRQRTKSQSAVTDLLGSAHFAASFAPGSTVISFCITAVTAEGYTYWEIPAVACFDGYLPARTRGTPAIE